MKNMKLQIPVFTLALLMGSFLFSQDFDDLDDLGLPQEKVVCIPDSFNTPYEYLGAVTLKDQDVAIKFSYVKDYARKQDWEKVQKYGWELIYGDKKRMFKSVYDKLADSYYYQNYPDSTLLVCLMGLSDVGDRTRLNYYAAIIQLKLGRYECAEGHYRKLIEASPDELSYWKALTSCLVKQDKEEAIQAQEKVVELSNNDPQEQAIMAQLYDRYGLNAMDAYVQSWETNANAENMKAALQVTMMALQQGRYDIGVKVGNEALKIDPKNKAIMRNLGDLYQGQLNFDAALTYYKKYLDLEPNNMDVHCSIADIYREKKNWSAARSYAVKAMKIDPVSGKPHKTLAEVYQASATECLNSEFEGKINIDIKLVFEMAYYEYNEAAKDPAYTVDAKGKMDWLRGSGLTPSKEDRFMHPDVKKPRLECFSWI